MKATWNGVVIADSDDTVVVEGNHYFPRESVNWDLLTATATQTTCPWKGQASYWTITAGGQSNPDAVWAYLDPKPEAAHIKDHVAFWRGVSVTA
jgi:uncharacterized protein (DUF427 family)